MTHSLQYECVFITEFTVIVTNLLNIAGVPIVLTQSLQYKRVFVTEFTVIATNVLNIAGVPDTLPRHSYSKPLDMNQSSSSAPMDSQTEMPFLPELSAYSDEQFGGGFNYALSARDTTLEDTEMEDA